MAVSVIGTPASDRGSPSGSPFTHTFSYNVASGTDILVVGVSFYPDGGLTVDAVKFGGVSLTKAVGVANGTLVASEIWYLQSPTSGTDDIKVEYSANPGSNESIIHALCLDGAEASGDPVSDSDTETGTGSSSGPLTLTAAASGEMGVDCVSSYSQSGFTPDSGQTERTDEASGTNTTDGATSTEPGAASMAMGMSFDSGTNPYAYAAASFKESSGGSTVQGAVTEGVKAGDSYTATMTLQASVTEGISAGDTDTNVATLLAALTEGIKAGETWAGAVAGVLTGAVTEGIDAGDTYEALIALLASVSEGTKAGDTFASTLQALASVSEGAVAGDAVAVVASLQAALTEGVKVGDTWVGVNLSTAVPGPVLDIGRFEPIVGRGTFEPHAGPGFFEPKTDEENV